LFFGFFLVLFSALKLPRTAAYVKAQAPTTGQEELVNLEDGEMLESKKDEVEKIDYYLPYPGILPDHPLYWLKMVRDRIRLWLTRDTEARYERLLLYADKRVGAAKALVDGGQADLGVTTATKAEKYLEEAVNQFGKVKELGKAYPERVEHLKMAVLKHEEVLREVKEGMPDQAKSAIDQAIEKTVMQREMLRERFEEREKEGEGEQVQNEVQTQIQEQEQEQQDQEQGQVEKNQGKGKEKIDKENSQKGGL